MGLWMDGLTTMQIMKFCPQDGVALVPPPAEWKENQLEYEKRMKFATCPVCHKTARQLFRLDDAEPSPTTSPERPVKPKLSDQQKSFKKFVQEETAAMVNMARRFSRPDDAEKQRELKEKYLRQQYTS